MIHTYEVHRCRLRGLESPRSSRKVTGSGNYIDRYPGWYEHVGSQQELILALRVWERLSGRALSLALRGKDQKPKTEIMFDAKVT